MWVRELHLIDFRSYPHVDLSFQPGATVLLGNNGQGKTNLVEAIGYAASLESMRTHHDPALIRLGTEQAIIRLVVSQRGRDLSVELELNAGRGNRARVNGQPVARMREVVGQVRCSIFAPEHLRLVKGDPGDRRRFLDTIMVQVAPRYLAVRADFDRVLKQRNAALRSLATAPGAEARAVLAAWDERYIPIAAELTWGRLNAVRNLAEPIARAYTEVSPQDDQVSVRYAAAAGAVADCTSKTDLAELLAQASAARSGEELRRGMTLLGPHRDDLVLDLNGHPARLYASHGESWTLALALQLAAFHVLEQIGDDPPILILDDVFAELDATRRDRLLAAVAGAEQVLVTAAVPADVPAAIAGQQLHVTRVDGHSTITR